MEYKYYLSRLDKGETELYSFIYNKLLNFVDSFEAETTTENIDKIIRAILFDNPELFWFEGKWGASCNENTVSVHPKYKMRINHGKILSKITSIVDDIIETCVGSEVEKIKYVYDWLLANIKYCYTDNDQTIEGAFVDKKAVCKGISKAFQLLMNKLDIPSILVAGTLDGHSSHIWNMVFVDNQFYHVDVAIGYQRFSGLFDDMDRNCHYPCFMVSDKTISATHTIFSRELPECAEDFNLDKFFIEFLRVPNKFKQFGTLKYLDKGSTCAVLKISCENSDYVLKVIDAKRHKQALDELIKMKLLANCEQVVHLVDGFVSEQNETVYILTDYYKPLTVRRKEKDFETIYDTMKLGLDILNALIECRKKGIYHLDIQPKNIYFDKQGKAVLGDFGNAVFESELSNLLPSRGTLAFMAPEVYFNGEYGQASEIYSLGIIMYSLLNNALLPFTSDNSAKAAIKMRLQDEPLPPPINGEKKIWKCVNKMCAYDINERFAVYEDALTEIERIMKEEK